MDVIDSKFGKLGITVAADKLTTIKFLPDTASVSAKLLPLTQEFVRQLDKYSQDSSAKFSLPLSLQGTSHQLKVWQALQAIPLGATRTYGELAGALQSSPRAIGNACRNNPLPIIIPCHRVVAKTGLGGFAGDTTGRLLMVKKQLLSHEGLFSAP